MFYNPANDPAVINGIQEAYGFKIGDVVEYTNPQGVKFGPRKVIGFPENCSLSGDRVYINSDSPWYPVEAKKLEHVRTMAEVETIKDEPRYPKHGGDCEYTEDCMWGVDGWCDRPEDRKCVIAKIVAVKDKPRITIEVSCGIVQNVYTSLETDVEVDVLDFDDNGSLSDGERKDMKKYLERVIAEQRLIY